MLKMINRILLSDLLCSAAITANSFVLVSMPGASKQSVGRSFTSSLLGGGHSSGELGSHSLLPHLSRESEMPEPLPSLRVLEHPSLAWGDNLSCWLGIALGFDPVRIGVYGGVHLLVGIFTGLCFHCC